MAPDTIALIFTCLALSMITTVSVAFEDVFDPARRSSGVFFRLIDVAFAFASFVVMIIVFVKWIEVMRALPD